MQHELYPETAHQASRQIFTVQEIEVRDRLTLSKINKFLYQYTSDAMPKRTHADMVRAAKPALLFPTTKT